MGHRPRHPWEMRRWWVIGPWFAFLLALAGGYRAASAVPRAAVAPQTALVTLALDSSGSMTVAHVSIKLIPWTSELAPIAPGWELPPSDAERRSLERARGRQREVHVVVHYGATAVGTVVLRLDGPSGGKRGDVGDPWDGGAVVVRLPWFGESTQLVGWTAPKPAANASDLVFTYAAGRAR